MIPRIKTLNLQVCHFNRKQKRLKFNLKNITKGESKNNRQVLVQIIGDKKKTDMIKLKDPSNDEEEIDAFAITNKDLGKVT